MPKPTKTDEDFLDSYLGGDYTPEDVAAAVRRATLARNLTPTFCGSALRNAGVQPVLDAVCDYLPAPEDIPAPVARDADGKEIVVTPNGPVAALVFKVLMEEGRKLAFLRLYAGSIKEGDSLRNTTTGKDDRVGRLYRMHADRREQLAEAGAGDIVAVIGLRGARTGDTYTTHGGTLRLEAIDSYPPVITLALEPRNADEGKVLDEALSRYMEEDPTFHAVMDEESATRTISGMGELHLEVLLERLTRECGISPRVGHPQVTLRETIRKTASASQVFDRDVVLDELQALGLPSPGGRSLSPPGVSCACLMCHSDNLSSCNGAGDAASRTERCAWQIGAGNRRRSP